MAPESIPVSGGTPKKEWRTEPLQNFQNDPRFAELLKLKARKDQIIGDTITPEWKKEFGTITQRLSDLEGELGIEEGVHY